jgi:hypothetical protein
VGVVVYLNKEGKEGRKELYQDVEVLINWLVVVVQIKVGIMVDHKRSIR